MCDHERFTAHVSVYRLAPETEVEDIVAFAADVVVECSDCGESFGFRCPDVGLLPDRPAVSPDALTLRVPLISPAELELAGPLAAMQTPSPVPGFRVQSRD